MCVHKEAFLLNTSSGGIPGPRRWLLKPGLKEFRKCGRGHIADCEQEKVRWESDEGRAEQEGRDIFCLPFVAPWRIKLVTQIKQDCMFNKNMKVKD